MNITVLIYCLGTETKTIKIPEGTKVIEALDTAGFHSEKIVPFINHTKVSKNRILLDGDKIFICNPTKGALDVKHKGKRWRIYLTDKDTVFPSDFHAHSYDSKEVMNLYDGNIFDKVNKKYKSKLKQKELCQFFEKIITQYGDSPITRKARYLLGK